MKKLVFACLLAFSISGLGSPLLSFADGRYLGAGNWRDDAGNSGIYESYIEFNSNNTRADYAWSTGVKEVILSFSFDSWGNFIVSKDGIDVGSGYCMSMQCWYSFVLDGYPVNESFTFLNNRLYKLGTGYNSSGTAIYWEEDLQLLPTTFIH